MWVIVNYSVGKKKTGSENETFFVDEQEENDKAYKKQKCKIKKYIFPLVSFIFYISKYI